MASKKKPAPSSSGFPWLKSLALLGLIGVTLMATVYIMFLQPATVAPGKKATQEAGKNTAPPPVTPLPAAAPAPAEDRAAAESPTPPEPAGEPIETVAIDRQEAAALPPAPAPPIASQTAAAPSPPPAEPPTAPAAPPPPHAKPLLAIIIDDLGQQKKVPEQLLALGLNFSFAFLPHTPFAKELARQAQAGRHDLLLHLPMEPEDSHWNPGAGTLLAAMDQATIRKTIDQDLAAVPLAVGINNHMGSRFTADRAAMTLFFKTIKERRLFFVDSLTTAKSVGSPLAKEMGIKTARRDLFLDNEPEPDKIVRQIQALIALAQKNGSAIGIGHPYPPTLAALTQMQEQLRTQVTMVGVQTLVK